MAFRDGAIEWIGVGTRKLKHAYAIPFFTRLRGPVGGKGRFQAHLFLDCKRFEIDGIGGRLEK